MANIFLNLPLPALNGAGAAVDVSAQGGTKTIICDGTFPGATIVIEASVDGGVTYGTVMVLQTGSTEKTIGVAAQFMRLNVSGRKTTVPFAADVDVAADDSGAQFASLPMPALNGPGAQVDVSAYPSFYTFIVSGAMVGAAVSIEVSEDGSGWGSCAQFSGSAGLQSKTVTAKFMRANVSGRKATVPFTATAAIGSAIGGGGGGLAGIIRDVFTASGTWICPDGVTEIDELWLRPASGGGGGGSAGGAGFTGASGGGGKGGGGGGGGGSSTGMAVRGLTVVPGVSYTVLVPDGGSGGNAGTGGAGAGGIGTAGLAGGGASLADGGTVLAAIGVQTAGVLTGGAGGGTGGSGGAAGLIAAGGTSGGGSGSGGVGFGPSSPVGSNPGSTGSNGGNPGVNGSNITNTLAATARFLSTSLVGEIRPGQPLGLGGAQAGGANGGGGCGGAGGGALPGDEVPMYGQPPGSGSGISGAPTTGGAASVGTAVAGSTGATGGAGVSGRGGAGGCGGAGGGSGGVAGGNGGSGGVGGAGSPGLVVISYFVG